MRIHKLFFLGLILIFAQLEGQSQEPKNWQSFPAQMNILDASMQDGNIWLGTDNGLYELRNDGTVKNKYDQFNGLPSNHIRAAHAASGGGSWVGTYAAVIKKIEDDEIQPMNRLNDQITDSTLHAIETIKGTNQIGILTDSTYYSYDGQTIQSRPLPASPVGFRSWNETHFKPQTDSTFWISDGHTFQYFNGQAYENKTNQTFNPYKDIALAYDDQGRLWASLEDQLAYRENGQWNLMDTSQIGLDSNIICMNRDEKGNLYVASQNRMVVRKNGSWQKFADLSGNFWDNKKDWILSAGLDNLFFPSKNESELAQFDGNQSQLHTLEGQILNDPYSLRSAGNQLWLKTSTPTAIYRWEGNRWENINIPPEYKDRVGGRFEATKNETFWVKGDSALFRYHEGNWKNFNEQNADLPQLSHQSQLKSFNEQLWISSEEGIHKFENGTFVLPEEPFKNQKTTPFTVTNGAIWFFDQQTETLKKWENGKMTEFNGGWHKGTTGDMSPRFIKSGPKGQVWVSSKSGLAYYDGNDWVFPESLNDIEGGFWTGINDFEVIDSNTYAVATQEGIAISHKDSIQWIQESNSHLTSNRVDELAVTDKREVGIFSGYNNDVSVFTLTEPGGHTTAINSEPEAKKLVQTYPNPVKDQLQIKLPSNTGKEATYRLYNQTGQLIKQGTFSTGAPHSIEAKTMDQGLYFLNVQNGAVNETSKILKR